MTKKFVAILIAVIISLSMMISASAYTYQYIEDPAGNLTYDEIEELEAYAEKIVEICKNWPGIDHRLQYFHTWNKNGALYKFYNDSCATVPEAAAMATQAFGKSVILFTGGTEKGLSLKPLIDVLKNKGNFDVQNQNKIYPVKEIYLLEGSATDSIIEELQKSQVDFYGPFESLDSLLKKFTENQLQKNVENCGKPCIFPYSSCFVKT